MLGERKRSCFITFQRKRSCYTIVRQVVLLTIRSLHRASFQLTSLRRYE